ncbi:MAG: zonular occludens toxin domain-containing protein [Rhodoferax sp.]|nr:zonular occludens toxin domain-containing protein [Rhodoferax sp.]
MAKQSEEEAIASAETGAPVVLITGLPGAGKTLYALAKFAVGRRDVYQCNIPGCILPVFDPTKWPELIETWPQDATMIFDEAREIFPPRNATQEVPDYYSFHRIRHTGRRVVIICQHPGDIDARVRRLVGRHLHLLEGFGGGHSVVYEFRGVGDTETRSRGLSSKFTHPKSVFKLYKSADAHHEPPKAPWRVRMIKWILPIVAVVLLVGGTIMFRTLKGLEHPGEKQAGLFGTGASSHVQPGESGREQKGHVMTTQEYLQSLVPRIPAFQYTASRYDEVTKPVRAPVPAACIESKSKGCTCWTQQATRLDVPKDTCDQIVKTGFFEDFDPDGKEKKDDKEMVAPVARSAVPAAGAEQRSASPDFAPHDVAPSALALAAADSSSALAPAVVHDAPPSYMPPPATPSKVIRH